MAVESYDTEKTQAPRPEGFESGGKTDPRRMMAEERMMQVQAAIAGCERDPLDDLFRYHPPTAEDLPKYAAINQAAKNFAEVLRSNCPTFSQDYRDAVRKIREARMIANAAVALKGRGI
jgi:hypothetical protein